MAIKVQQIDPLDLRTSVGVGVEIPFTGKAVFNTTYTTRDAIRSNIINYFLTNRGERYLNPTFGSDIRLLLFNNITEETTEEVKARVIKDITTYFPRVSPTQFEVTGNPDSQSFRVYFKYKIVNSNIDDEILINIEQ